MLDEPRLAAGDAGSPTCLAQVLARKSGGDEIDGWQLFEIDDVADEFCVGEPNRQNTLSGRVPLAKQFGVMARFVEAELEATDSGEQARDAERSCGRHER